MMALLEGLQTLFRVLAETFSILKTALFEKSLQKFSRGVWQRLKSVKPHMVAQVSFFVTFFRRVFKTAAFIMMQ